jgi:hypothetical protein
MTLTSANLRERGPSAGTLARDVHRVRRREPVAGVTHVLGYVAVKRGRSGDVHIRFGGGWATVDCKHTSDDSRHRANMDGVDSLVVDKRNQRNFFGYVCLLRRLSTPPG